MLTKDQRAHLVPLTAIKVEVWNGDEMVRSQIMNWAREEERRWFQNLHIWAWSNGVTIISYNIVDRPANEPRTS